MALGADKRAIVRLVIRYTMLLSLTGVILGTIGALALTRLLATLLFTVKPTDVTVFATAACVLTSVAFAASFLPARQAGFVDPLVALKAD